MSKVSGKAAAAREKARQKDGKFGVQPKLEAGIKLEDLSDKDLDSYTRSHETLGRRANGLQGNPRE
ncbi:hypothetical protein CYK25_009135 [Varibaculum cambriense]|nr:hypothetical protein CYK25_009135 [Varibaculum cambriense]